MKIQDLYIRLIGKTAHVTCRRDQHVSRVIADYHRELEVVLNFIYNIGEAPNIAPLKGVAGIVRLILGIVKVRPFHHCRHRACLIAVYHLVHKEPI
jgi:hypothetical protein